MEVSKFIPKIATRVGGKAALKLKKNSPHILFGVGVTGVVGGTVLACRATLKLNDTVDEFKAEVDHNKDDATDRDMAYIYVKNSMKIVKLYAPAVLVGGVGLGCLTGSHVQLSRRNGALTAAYAGLMQAYDAYRARVREEIGEEKEAELYTGILTQKVDLDGKKVDLKVIDPNGMSQYAKIFDELNPRFEKDAELNRVFIQCQQNYFNHILQVRGHVFLNEVYDALGFDHTKAGAIVGWVMNGDCDHYIDFAIFDAYNSRFVNGWERALVLDFNVDGVILDKVGG